MRIIVITLPTFFSGEGAEIERLLNTNTCDAVHLRKPDSTEADMERLITAIPPELHGRLVTHDHFNLAVRYALGGVHLNRRNSIAPHAWQGTVSRSCHTLEEVSEWREHCDYVTLSPIFDSISKAGYTSRFTREQLIAAHSDGIINEKVMALGGVTFARLDEVERMGFGGAMILGDAWKHIRM